MPTITHREFYSLGLPRGQAIEARMRVDLDIASDAFLLSTHGLGLNDQVSFVPDGAGSVLPSPLVSTAIYYAVPGLLPSVFQVSATEFGAAVALLDAGVGRLAVVPDIAIVIDSAIAYVEGVIRPMFSELWDDIQDDPGWYWKGVVAKLAAREVLERLNQPNEGVTTAAGRTFADLKSRKAGHESKGTGSGGRARQLSRAFPASSGEDFGVLPT